MYKKRKTENNLLIRLSCSILFSQGLLLSVLVSKAQAGGYDAPTPFSSLPSLVEPNERSPVVSLFWEKWGTPYWLNSNICRENNGNLSCFSPQVARQLRWEVPSRNKTRNPK